MAVSLKRLYETEVEAEARKGLLAATGIITEDVIAGLPEPVREHFRRCGRVGKPNMKNACVLWKGVSFKPSPERKWIALECRQFNSVPEPARIVYMKTRIGGLIPFEARDKYQDGHGNMLIRLARLFTVADARGPEMDASALVTFLAEALLVPSCALAPYITWTAVNSRAAGAAISFSGVTVKGLFRFNTKGEFVRFETNGRYYAAPNGLYEKIGWYAVAGDYAEKNGVRFPTTLSAAWRFKGGDFEYFTGTLGDITYDVGRAL
jgi:hypothetical protein